MRALVAPQDQAPNCAPEAVSLVRLAAAEKEVSASLHEGTVEIPRLETAFPHLRMKGRGETTAKERGGAETNVPLFNDTMTLINN